MGKLFAHIVQFFNRNIAVYLAVLLGIIVFAFFGFKRLQLDENIYSIFPQGKEFRQFNTILKSNNLNKQVLFSINAEGKEIFDLEIELDSIAGIVGSETKGLLTDIKVVRANQEDAVLNYFYAHYPSLLVEDDYKTISQKLDKDSIRVSIGTVAERLSSASSLFMRDILARDPLGLAWEKLQLLNPQSDSNSMTVEDGILFGKNKEKAIFTAILAFELDDSEKNEALNKSLERLKVKLNAAPSEIDFDYFGTFQISYENARQVKEDTFITMLVSVGLILLLLIVYYRSVLTPIYFVLPALFSAFCGLGVVGYIQLEISAISIATSAVLLGIVLDYSFHFFTHYTHTRDLSKTVKELSFPMLVGSFTTVAAFAALLFTDSIVLKNFGLIALVTLSSAALFTLLLLPPLIHFTRFKPKERKTNEKRFNIPKLATRLSIFAIIAISVVFLFTSNTFQFDADLNNLSYHTEELAEKEDYYTGINPREEKKIHLFVTGDSKEEALEKNFALYEQLMQYKTNHDLDELISVGSYAIPTSVKEERFGHWSAFWKDRSTETLAEINQNAVTHDFSPIAFEPFKNWISSTSSSVTLQEQEQLLNNLGLSSLIYEKDGQWSVTSSVVLQKEDVTDFKNALSQNGDVFIFDVSEMANQLMLSVQDDFSYLLFFSSLLVFFSLLIIYGRIELALFAFFPMVISWIWIIGISGYVGLEFNFVNIIIVTFIFGLGDDFSIFVTDGLIQEYKTKSTSLGAYKSAIILSGVTTIIGTGALYFAKHPAIHSIALISVVGIGCIMLVTLLVQPSIFRYFVTNRTKRKRSPMTFLGLIYSIFLFLYFFAGCMVLNVLLLLLLPLPFSSKRKRALMNFTLSKLAKSTLDLGFHIKKRIRNREHLDFSRPSVVVANHSSFLDILMMIALNPKSIIMVKKWVYYSPFFGLFIRYCGYLYIAEGTEYNLKKIQRRVEEGYSIVIFPEGTRSLDGEIKRFHKGAFYLAKEMNIDIQPILIVGANYVNSKNDLIIKSGCLAAHVLERIKTSDELYQKRFGELTKAVVKLMRSALIEARKQENTSDFLRKRIIYNYLYKGPGLEWYVRIKMRFETKNFDFYEQEIGDRMKILDIGCGLGYLGYFLHYRDASRTILGVDYDAEKIVIAQNGYDKNDQLQFVTGDVRTFDFGSQDVIFFNDVLHYLASDEQLNVLKNATEALSENGLLFIRDGITDNPEKHALTQRTEKYSTRIINFNKTTNDLHFFSSQDMFKFAEEHGMECQMIEQSKRTSNVLFILRK